jgi:hypothetical protein
MVKDKVKLSLCLTKHYAMKTYGWVDVQIHVLLSSALVRDEWLASRPGRFIPRIRVPGTHWIGGRVGPRTLGKRKNSWPYRDSNSNPSVFQPVAGRIYRLSYPGSTLTCGWWIGKDLLGSVRGIIEVLSQYSPGGPDETHEKLRSGYMMSGTGFEGAPPE